MENLRVEYLISIETKKNFCNSIKGFNNLLEVSDEIKIEKGKIIKYKDLNVIYEVQTGELSEKEQRFFHIKFTCKQIDRINEYSNFLRVIRDILIRVTGKQPISLWDDISFYYANKSYPLIHEIENLMRKLLTKFAFTKFDSNWTDKNIPDEVKTSVKSQALNNDANYLYQTDFIQLINFLSGKIETSGVKNLIDDISQAKNVSDLDLERLKSFIPTNNWDKYFSNLVEFEWEYFEKRWRKLYELRCKVAHNNFLNKNDFEEICRYVEELKPKLQKAIDEMDKVKVLDEDQDVLAETFAENTNAAYGEFINLWKVFQKELHDLAIKVNGGTETKEMVKNRFVTERTLRVLVEKGLIKKEFLLKITRLRHLRNSMVHKVDLIISESEIFSNIELLRSCINEVRTIG